MEKIWLAKYPKMIPHEVDLTRYTSVSDVFEKACKKFGDKPAFSCMGKTDSYKQMDELVTNFASFLQNDLGLKKGDRIALQMPNVLQYPIAMFGALKAGLIIVNTNPLYSEREMHHQFVDAECKAIVILANFAHHLEKILHETKIEHVVVTEIGDMLNFPKNKIVNFVVKNVKRMVPSYSLPKAYSFNEALELGAQKSFATIPMNLDDIAFLQYTGGTTGVSKGATLTNRNIVANMEQICLWMLPLLKEGEEIAITALPLYHIFSLTVNACAIMKYGGHNVLITNPRDMGAFIKELKKVKFSVITGVNTLFNGLLHQPAFCALDFSSLKISIAGGMALQKAVAQRWQDVTKTKIAEGYGLTETSPVATCNPIDGNDQVGTIGLPLPSTDIKIIDDDGHEVPLGHPGELCVKGPQVMRGYWKRDDETALVMTADGWLKTGDIAQIEPDGFFRIVDRKKDMILVSGFNVYPNEVEDVVATHPGVLEVAAIGVPDEKSGEVVKIFVVKKDPNLTPEMLIKHCKANLAGYKVPRNVEFRTELPKSNIGKILRRSLRNPVVKEKPLEA